MGVLYRDLKPENILVSKDGYLKLTDFGLSKLSAVGLTEISKDCDEWVFKGDERVIGTPDYMAPEVLLNHKYSIASEWWAFGCLIYELLTGLPPFFKYYQ